MYPISNNTLGTSGAFKTTKPADLRGLGRSLTEFRMDDVSLRANERDHSLVLSWVRSRRMFCTTGSKSPIFLIPMIKSTLFSRAASAAASLSDAFSDRV